MMMDNILEAANFISSKINVKPQFGIILGSGLGSFADELESPVSIPFEDIPHFPVSTVEGHEGKMVVGIYKEIPVMILQGRFHYYEGYSMDQVAFPVRCMISLSIPNLIVTNAAGSVDINYKPGDLMLICDHMKFHADSPLRGKNFDTFGPRFNDMSDPYTKTIRSLAKECAKGLEIPLKEGVYYYMTGPSYETRSEVKAINILGANVVGMSTVPEVIVASHAGMQVMGLSCITNMATGILDQPISHDEVITTGKMVKEKFIKLLEAILIRWGKLSS
jgi:purine-nucleoside phosphorylase